MNNCASTEIKCILISIFDDQYILAIYYIRLHIIREKVEQWKVENSNDIIKNLRDTVFTLTLPIN